MNKKDLWLQNKLIPIELIPETVEWKEEDGIIYCDFEVSELEGIVECGYDFRFKYNEQEVSLREDAQFFASYEKITKIIMGEGKIVKVYVEEVPQKTLYVIMFGY